MYFSFKEQSQKLRHVSQVLGYDHPLGLLHNYLHDQIVLCICIDDGCNYIGGAPRDEAAGHCPNCNADSVASIFILAGVE